MTTSLLYVCLDGLGDDPIPAFDGRTPLEAADTHNLDALATRGRTGTVLTVGPGIAPESDIGVFGILGYDPHEEHPGRGNGGGFGDCRSAGGTRPLVRRGRAARR